MQITFFSGLMIPYGVIELGLQGVGVGVGGGVGWGVGGVGGVGGGGGGGGGGGQIDGLMQERRNFIADNTGDTYFFH